MLGQARHTHIAAWLLYNTRNPNVTLDSIQGLNTQLQVPTSVRLGVPGSM